MKKLIIITLSIFSYTQAFGIPQALKNGLKVGAKGTYGFLLIFPGYLNAYNHWKHKNDIETNSGFSPANTEVETEITSYLKQNGFTDVVKNIKVAIPTTPLSDAAVSDSRHYGNKTIHILVDSSWPEARTLRKNALLKHEMSHIKNRDIAVRSGLIWSSGILGHLAYSVLLKHPVARATKTLIKSQKAQSFIEGTTQLIGAISIRNLLLSYGHNMLCRAQEKKADLSLTDPKEVAALSEYFQILDSIITEEVKKADTIHPPFQERIEYLEEHYKKLTQEDQ